MTRTHSSSFGPRVVRAVLLLAGAVVATGCALDKQAVPTLSGPSGLGLSISMSASPDRLPRDGASQSVVTLTVRDAQGKTVAGQRLALRLAESSAQGAELTAYDVTTNASGQATFGVYAPASGSFGDIEVTARPFSTDANNDRLRTISIAALPRNGTAPSFASTPFVIQCTATGTACASNPEVGQSVTFRALDVTDEGATCNTCTYTWDFGNDGKATGQVVTHAFGAGGNYLVVLTVTDQAGSFSTAQRVLTVGAVTIPTSISMSTSPATPVAKQATTFTFTATASTNHRIVTYDITWGDGQSNQSSTGVVQHTYNQSGAFAVTVTVRDDLGQTATRDLVVTVSSGLTSSFTFSPSGPTTGATVTYDGTASSSSVASTISDWAWDFGDGNTGTGSTTTHSYSSAGTYTIKLTITDSRGVTQSSTQTITVS